MTEKNGPTGQQLKLLWLVAELLGDEQAEGLQRFLKESALHAVFFLASERGLLPYDTAPVLTNWHGDTRYACLSQEGIEDLGALEKRELLQRLELTGSHHGFFSAYRMTDAGRAEAARVPREITAALESLVRCACGDRWVYTTGKERVWRSCPRCGIEEEIGCLEIPKLPYTSVPRFPNLLGLGFPDEENASQRRLS
ncbi:MAG: hypothetical protein A2Y64_09300 [Candidatus Coatesbacteria bacterium RBG_13_66_14]|uniref:Uncharacterized protein n=1 Tax=Candidatus Coatesbacteria bacterium RBG_13_66_14 TaxID=1817816 RepID=A0A1F5EXM6_9BACT|nr:MAG: hypothetical protein A2Y64_09300 [Candidatus Coatesbacteria bacterium RBG_13_66_14]